MEGNGWTRKSSWSSVPCLAGPDKSRDLQRLGSLVSLASGRPYINLHNGLHQFSQSLVKQTEDGNGVEKRQAQGWLAGRVSTVRQLVQDVSDRERWAAVRTVTSKREMTSRPLKIRFPLTKTRRGTRWADS